MKRFFFPICGIVLLLLCQKWGFADPVDWTVHGGPEAGFFHYYEGANIDNQNFYGAITLPDYGFGIGVEGKSKTSGVWGGAELSQHWTGYGSEAYLIYTNSPGVINLQQNRQTSQYSNFYGDAYLGYQFPVSRGSFGFYTFAGYRSMSINFNGGTFTTSACATTCAQTGAGNLIGTGNETDSSPVIGGGIKFYAPLRGHWSFNGRLQYGALTNVTISNNFIIAGTTQTISARGVDGFVDLNFENRVSDAFSYSIGYKGEFAGVNQSGINSSGVFYPGGGWSDSTLSGQAVFHF